MNMIQFGMIILLFGLGNLVKEMKMAGLIAGYNTSTAEKKQEHDKDVLARGIGQFLYGLGGITLAGAIGEFFKLI